LIISPDAGGMSESVQRRILNALDGFRVTEFNPHRDLLRDLAPAATVVVAGGDGTVGSVVRRLAGSRHRLGIVPLGTFNNFARALRLPASVGGALRVIRTGRTQAVTVGRINGRPFLEVGAVGMFGQALILGEAAKDREFGRLRRELGAFVGATRFAYRISGDIDAEGHALSLVFTNTPTTGARMAIGSKRPEQPFLEMVLAAGRTRSDVIGRVVAAAVSQKQADSDTARFRFRRLRIETKPRMRAFADNEPAGRTPLVIAAASHALRVIVP
jgi:diacylglycerol kinase family enzyme